MGGVGWGKEKRREEKKRDEKFPLAAIIDFGANPIRGGSWGL